MINLSGNGSIWAACSNNNQVICTISGMQLNNGVESYQLLGQAYVLAAAGNMYTVPANQTAFVKRIFLVNNNSSAVAGGVVLYANGTGNANNSINQITGVFSIPASGFAIYDESGISVYDANAAPPPSLPPLVFKSVQVLTGNTTTYVTPANTASIYVRCLGPGGGGGGANANAANNGAFGGGGGAGGEAEALFTSPSGNYTVAIGAGGAGGSAAGGNGANGNANTTFTFGGTVLVAGPGLGGVGMVGGNTATSAAGGAGGAANNGNINITGGSGGPGWRLAGANQNLGLAGDGGIPPLFGGSVPGSPVTGNGSSGVGYGSGGAGGAANGSGAGNGVGGVGANGAIIVWEFS